MIINFAHDFTPCPGGRYLADGAFSAQRFREDLLVPALKARPRGEVVEVQMDGVHGFGGSFLEEAFGGLVRVHHYDALDLSVYLRLTGADDALIARVFGYICDAQNAQNNALSGYP